MQSLTDKIVFNPPPLGCVLSLPGLPGAGSTIYDRSPYGNNGTITGATWKFNGIWYLDFDGTDDIVTVSDHASLNFGTGEFALEFWGKLDTLNLAGAFNNALGKLLNGTTYDGYVIGIKDSGFAYIRWRTASTNYDAVGSTILTGKICHHVGLRNSSGLYLYTDGQLVGSNTDVNIQTNEDNTEQLAIGSERSGSTVEGWDGGIFLLRVYNRAALEILNHYQQEKSLFGVV